MHMPWAWQAIGFTASRAGCVRRVMRRSLTPWLPRRPRQGQDGRPGGAAARAALGVLAQVVGEDLQGAGDQPGRAVGQVAGAPAADQGQQVPGPAEHLRPRLPERDLAQRLRQGGQALGARAALAGALPGQVAHHPRGLGQRARGGREHDQDAGAERGPGGRQRPGR